VLIDVLTIVWKESKEFIQGSSRAGTIARLAFPIALAGIFVPWRAGRAYVTGVTAMFGLLWILPMVAVSLTIDAIAGERERHTLESLLATQLSDQAILFGKLTASVIHAWAIMLASLLVGLVTVNLRRPAGALLLFSPAYLITLLSVGLLASILVCSLAVLVSVRAPTVRQAAQTFAYSFMGIFIAASFAVQSLAPSRRLAVEKLLTGRSEATTQLTAGLAVLAVDGMVVLAARRRFQRARLILD
jgi:ABC-2 type transport system permease protein